MPPELEKGLMWGLAGAVLLGVLLASAIVLVLKYIGL